MIIKYFFSPLIFRTLMGLLLVSIAIFSVIQVGIALQEILSHYDNSPALELASFSFIALLSILTIYFLFDRQKAKFNTQAQSGCGNLDIENLALKFLEGFLQGINKENK